MVECRIRSREVAGSNLGLGYFTPRSTQPSIPPGSINEYQLRLGRQRQVWLIPLADETQGVQVKLCYPLTQCVLYLSALEMFRVQVLYKSTSFTCNVHFHDNNGGSWYQTHTSIHHRYAALINRLQSLQTITSIILLLMNIQISPICINLRLPSNHECVR